MKKLLYKKCAHKMLMKLNTKFHVTNNRQLYTEKVDHFYKKWSSFFEELSENSYWNGTRHCGGFDSEQTFSLIFTQLGFLESVLGSSSSSPDCPLYDSLLAKISGSASTCWTGWGGSFDRSWDTYRGRADGYWIVWRTLGWSVDRIVGSTLAAKHLKQNHGISHFYKGF